MGEVVGKVRGSRGDDGWEVREVRGNGGRK